MSAIVITLLQPVLALPVAAFTTQEAPIFSDQTKVAVGVAGSVVLPSYLTRAFKTVAPAAAGIIAGALQVPA